MAKSLGKTTTEKYFGYDRPGPVVRRWATCSNCHGEVSPEDAGPCPHCGKDTHHWYLHVEHEDGEIETPQPKRESPPMHARQIAMELLAVLFIVVGTGSRYDPGVFSRTVRIRQSYGSLPANLPDYDGAHIALLDCARVGDVVLVCAATGCRYALVADCAGIADGGAAWMKANAIAGELDYRTAVALQSTGKELRIYGGADDIQLAGIVPGAGISPDR